jgi:transposase
MHRLGGVNTIQEVMNMTSYREILRLYSQGLSQRSIAASCGCGKGTVQRTLEHAKKHNLAWPLPPEMTEGRLRDLFSPSSKDSGYYKELDFEWVHREMAKSGVTLSLLWNEYCAQCRQNGEIPYMYTAFCDRYRDYSIRNKATMHIERKPGERMEVDWAGQTMEITDNLTGEIIPAYIFAATLSYSGYAYVEAFLSRNQENWIAAHVNAYRFFGGATRILVPDNLKTGVIKNTKSEVVLNRAYQELSEHYGTAVLPARVRKPKDKPSVEGAVGVISTWVIAALRDWKFFSLRELNEAIRGKLEEFHRKPFQKKEGNRMSVFLEEEKHLLLPLPPKEYELAQWKVCTVAYNYHISPDKMFYSVPYVYIKKKVDVRLTRSMAEVFFDGERIAAHARKHGRPGQYSTLPEHMPEEHRRYTQWNAERFLSWARSIGGNTMTAVKAILASRKIEQQSYRACMALLKLNDKYSAPRLETACKRALTYTPSPSFKSIQTILATGQDKLPDEEAADPSAEFGFTRGPGYYGDGGDE